MIELAAVLLLVASWLAYRAGSVLEGAILASLALAAVIGGWLERDRRA